MKRITLIGLTAMSVLAPLVAGADVSNVTVPTPASETVYGQIVEGFQLVVSTDQPGYPVGVPVYIDVRLKNTTDATLKMLYQAQVEEYLNISVCDDTGKKVPLTAYGVRNYTKPNFSGRYAPFAGTIRQSDVESLPARQDIHFRILLSRLYDMSEEHHYFITLSQWVPRQDSEGVVTLTSQTLSVLLSDPKMS